MAFFLVVAGAVGASIRAAKVVVVGAMAHESVGRLLRCVADTERFHVRRECLTAA